MKTKKLLIAASLTFGLGMGVNAQIINSTQPDMGVWSNPDNTGLAIAPGLDVQAAVYDDNWGNYHVSFIESASSTIVDHEMNSGYDPDVAYYANADALIVGYENGGDVFVDEYYLTFTPGIDYVYGGTYHISGGKAMNVDMNSHGHGVLTWEDGGDVFACTYHLGGGVGPVTHIDGGIQPDIVLFDNDQEVAITYIQGGPGGPLFIETMDHGDLSSGNHSPIHQWQYPPVQLYEHPRIASNRNVNFGGSPDNFTVVAQDYNNFPSAMVDAFFVTNGSTMNGPVSVNPNFATCYGDDPLPVVTYHLGRVRVAWSQYYQGGCSGLSQTNPNNEDDVLAKEFSQNGGTSGNYLEVNQHQSTYGSFSRTSIASEYDGNYSVNFSNYHGGIIFNDIGDFLWKGLSNAIGPNYMEENNTISEQENNFSLATSPVDQTIEVVSKSDEMATFQLIDNAGRVIELKTISTEGNNYSIDISHLSGGTYLLHCSSAAGDEVLRVLQVTK